MSLPLVYGIGFHKDVDDAFQWYEQQDEGLGERFLSALREPSPRFQKRHDYFHSSIAASGPRPCGPSHISSTIGLNESGSL